MKRTIQRMRILYGLAGLAAAWAGPSTAAGTSSGPTIIPGIGPGTRGVDAYVPNPDQQPPVYWSQGTAPPPQQPAQDYGGGFLQYVITGTERRPLPHDQPVSRQRYRLLPRPVSYNVPPVAYASAEPPPVYTPEAVAPVQAGIDPAYRRQEVAYAGGQTPGTIVIDTNSKFLYLVEGGGQAIRYGIGVGRPGFLWAGTKVVTRKAEWPDWTPPGEMLLRRPDLPRHMDGGIANPLGARALYLGSSLYRIHGTNEPNTIGTNVSSGCIRLLNEDVADLYNRVRVGTRVIVL
jgi:lipoprotein-anchoring transpeptidase ErfK/SrfK